MTTGSSIDTIRVDLVEGETVMGLTRKEKKAQKLLIEKERHEIAERHRFMKKYFNKRMEGASKFDAFVEKDYEDAVQRALETLGLQAEHTNEFSPLVISMPEAFYKGLKLRFKFGKKQDKIRYNHSRLTVLLFGEQQLFYYQTLVNHEENLFSDDHAVEVPYQTIVSVETQSTRFMTKKSFHHLIDLKLNLVNNQMIVVRLKDIIKKETELKKGVSIQKDTQKVLSDILGFLRMKRGL